MATLGTILVAPESGFRRYDDNDIDITYNGAWVRQGSGSSYSSYLGTWIQSVTTGDTITFTAITTKLRIIAYGNTDTSGFEVKIDGVSKGNFKTCYGTARPILACDINDLTFQAHNIEIIILDKSLYGSSLTRLLIDAIDIDDVGRLGSDIVACTVPFNSYSNENGISIDVSVFLKLHENDVNGFKFKVVNLNNNTIIKEYDITKVFLPTEINISIPINVDNVVYNKINIFRLLYMDIFGYELYYDVNIFVMEKYHISYNKAFITKPAYVPKGSKIFMVSPKILKGKVYIAMSFNDDNTWIPIPINKLTNVSSIRNIKLAFFMDDICEVGAYGFLCI